MEGKILKVLISERIPSFSKIIRSLLRGLKYYYIGILGWKSETNVWKTTKYSIRKLTVGVGPVAIGAFLLEEAC